MNDKKPKKNIVLLGMVSLFTDLSSQMIYPLIPEFAKFMGLNVERGAVIAGIVHGGPSDRAGLKGGDRQVRVGNSLILVGGDVIVEMDGKKVASSEDLIRMIKENQPGDNVDIKVLRKGRFQHFKVTLGEKPVQR